MSEENDADELDVTVGFTKDQQKCDKLKELMRTKGAIKVQEALGKYMENLKKDCASTLQVKDVLYFLIFLVILVFYYCRKVFEPIYIPIATYY